MKAGSPRWVEVTPSEFPWEREALLYLRERLPDQDPFRAWSNFEFIGGDGSINEVDLLVLAPAGFFLIEIKSRPGVVRGDAGTWTWFNDGRTIVVDNPLLLANRKAKKLKDLLTRRLGDRTRRIPFMAARVFLSAKDLECELDSSGRIGLFLRKRRSPAEPPRIDGIQEALLDPLPSDSRREPIDLRVAQSVDRAMERAGIRPSRASDRIGDYEKGKLLFEGETFQDFEGVHVSIPSVVHRLRVHSLPGDAPEEVRASVVRGARREFKVLQGIDHPGILRVLNYHEAPQLGPTLVFERDAHEQRLDHWLKHRETAPAPKTKLAILRSVAEALAYAHSRDLHHRALNPQCILLRDVDAERPRVLVFNWNASSRRLPVGDSTASHVTSTMHLDRLVGEFATCFLAPEALTRPEEGALLDVFSLGAVAWFLFVGEAPASSALDLMVQTNRHDGIDVSAFPEDEAPGLAELIQRATRPAPERRIASMEELLLELEIVAEE